jgi:hypothetical protein
MMVPRLRSFAVIACSAFALPDGAKAQLVDITLAIKKKTVKK